MQFLRYNEVYTMKIHKQIMCLVLFWSQGIPEYCCIPCQKYIQAGGSTRFLGKWYTRIMAGEGGWNDGQGQGVGELNIFVGLPQVWH